MRYAFYVHPSICWFLKITKEITRMICLFNENMFCRLGLCLLDHGINQLVAGKLYLFCM